MTRRQWRLSGLVICLASAVSASLVLAASRGAAVKATPVAGCEVSIAGRDMSRADRPSRALPIPASGTVLVSGVDSQTTTAAALDATLSPDMPQRAVWRVRERHFDPPATAYQLPLDMDDMASYGVGVNVITVTTDHCTATAWLRLSGRPPVFTAIGIAGFSIAAFGLIAVVVNLWRSGAGASGTFPGALGAGLTLGAGAGIVIQQAGLVPLTRSTVLGWIVFSAAGAAVLHLLRRMDSIRRAARAERVAEELADSS